MKMKKRDFFVFYSVDRITPATTDVDRDYVRSLCGIADGWPVISEQFIQWVIEDSFCNGRPPLELLSSSPYNVLLTEHVEVYECMKMRLLNASHTAMCSIGYLMGYTYIHEIILDEQIQIYIKQLMDKDITPILPPVPGIDFDQYKRTLIDRFSNPHIKDNVSRICMDGASKFPKFIVPTIMAQFKRGYNPHYCAFAIGAWIRYLGGFDEQNKPIILQDIVAVEHKLNKLAAGTKPDVKQILSVKQVFGVLCDNQKFTEMVERVVKLFYEIGSKETLKQWINEAPAH
jgi:mannitol 2-dehydrogenase